jgi:hypothetical protein
MLMIQRFHFRCRFLFIFFDMPLAFAISPTPAAAAVRWPLLFSFSPCHACRHASADY